ncbi:3-oxoacyl-[acyl-carrier-protein] reductase FabG, partial [Haemophilus influenzae]
GGGF